MADEEEDQTTSQEGAGPLRKKLSEVSNLATDALVRALIAEEGLSHISVEEFRGSDPTQVEGKARTLNVERQQAEEQALRRALEARGVTDIDAAIKALGGQNSGGSTQVDAYGRARSVGTLTGAPGGQGIDISQLPDQDRSAMKAHFAAQEKGQ